MLSHGNTGHFNLYVHDSRRVIYVMMTKFLYLKSNVFSLIFKFWLGMERKTYSWNEVVYLCIYIFTGSYDTHQTNCSFIMVKFDTTFFAFQSSVPFADSWSWVVIRFVCLDFNWWFSFHSFFSIYPSLIHRFYQGNVTAEFQIRNFTVGMCSLK